MNKKTENTVHPMLNPSEFFIPTPMIDELLDQVTRWIWNGLTGALILGQYRCGKTKAIAYIAEHLRNRLGQKIPAHRMTIPKRDRNTIASIWKTLCWSVDLKPKTRATSDEMSNLLFHYFMDLAHINTTKQIALFVDEMQRLDITQMEAFAELYDRLAEAHVNLSIFFVGNKEASQGLIDKTESHDYELVRGRFFTQSCAYYGIRTQSQLRECLGAYDTLDFPLEGGVSYTSHFAGEQCGDDWKLSSLTEIIWEVYSDNYQSKLNLKSWPMQYFTSAIRLLLMDFLSKYGARNSEEIKQMIDASIDASGLVPNLVRAA
jgi:hypothetical protein